MSKKNEKFMYVDIGCFHVHKQKGNYINTIGYVIANNNFDILDQAQLVINPNVDEDILRNSQIKADHTRSVFFEDMKDFYELRDDITGLMTANTNIGFSVESDLIYLANEYSRYNIRQPYIAAYDTRDLYREFVWEEDCKLAEYGVYTYEDPQDIHVGTLKQTVHALGIDFDNIQGMQSSKCKETKLGSLNKSQNDALLTYHVMRAICEGMGMDASTAIDYLGVHRLNKSQDFGRRPQKNITPTTLDFIDIRNAGRTGYPNYSTKKPIRTSSSLASAGTDYDASQGLKRAYKKDYPEKEELFI